MALVDEAQINVLPANEISFLISAEGFDPNTFIQNEAIQDSFNPYNLGWQILLFSKK